MKKKRRIETFDASPVDPCRSIVAVLKCRMRVDHCVIKRNRNENRHPQTARAYAPARQSLGTAWRRSTTGAPPYTFLLIHVESAESM